jgi:hypothetical protein
LSRSSCSRAVRRRRAVAAGPVGVGEHPLALLLGLPPHGLDHHPALAPAPLDLDLRLAAQLVRLDEDLPPPAGGLLLGPIGERPGLDLGLADEAGGRLLGLGADVAAGFAGGVEHPGRLLAQELDQAVLVEPLGQLGPALGPLGPLPLVGLAPLEPADHVGQLVQEGAHLGGVVPLAHGRELPAGDARGIEGRLGGHGHRWYDPAAPRAEGQFRDRPGWRIRPGCAGIRAG